MVLLPSVGVAAEDPLGDDHGGHGLRPAGVKGEMGDRFDELLLAVAVLLGVVEVEHELVGVAARGERSDGDKAALLGESSLRFQTSPKRTSSVNPTRAGAKSPSKLCALDGSLFSV